MNRAIEVQQGENCQEKNVLVMYLSNCKPSRRERSAGSERGEFRMQNPLDFRIKPL